MTVNHSKLRKILSMQPEYSDGDLSMLLYFNLPNLNSPSFLLQENFLQIHHQLNENKFCILCQSLPFDREKVLLRNLSTICLPVTPAAAKLHECRVCNP